MSGCFNWRFFVLPRVKPQCVAGKNVMNAINLSVMAGAKALHKPKSVNPLVDAEPAQTEQGEVSLCIERWNETSSMW